MSKLSRMGHALYQGKVSIDFVGRTWLWYGISAAIVLVAVLGLTVKGLNMGIEFEGGVEYRVSIASGTTGETAVEDIRDAVSATGIENALSPIVNTSGENLVRVQTQPLNLAESDEVDKAIRSVDGVQDLSSDQIGPSWGQAVAKRALLGLVVFVVLVVFLIWGYFREWKMSVAAMVALAHDLVITIGIYSLSGFEVTPATVTGILTILGFSLYDTVVVFDKVRENTKVLNRTHQTYAEAANLAVNQTLVRSINTSVVALLPVGALLYVGTVYLGSGSLKDLALALFVGMAAGAYSSIFIATPLLVQLKEREPGVRAGDNRARKHRTRREVDPFANVPAYSEDMPVMDDPDGIEDEPPAEGDGRPPSTAGGNRAVAPGAPGRYSAGERAPSSRPVNDTTSAGRPQPTRRPRSQRGKK
jgi:preprotein translocase subunit SecF